MTTRTPTNKERKEEDDEVKRSRLDERDDSEHIDTQGGSIPNPSNLFSPPTSIPAAFNMAFYEGPSTIPILNSLNDIHDYIYSSTLHPKGKPYTCKRSLTSTKTR